MKRGYKSLFLQNKNLGALAGIFEEDVLGFNVDCRNHDLVFVRLELIGPLEL